ncbi:MAG TPA: hypothetical protein VF163_17170, partial [Micromonosporaceae bacterium]
MAFNLAGLATTKGVVSIVAGTLVVGGAVAGGLSYVNREPALAVVQRSASATLAAHSDGSTTANCASHETALSGGFALTGPAFATTSMRTAPGSRDWVVAAHNPTDSAVTLTAYVVCVNAKVNVFTGSPSQIRAYSDRAADKILGGSNDLTTIEPMKNWYGEHVNPRCPAGTALVGFQFRAGRTVDWLAVAPVPLTALLPESGSTSMVYTNSGSDLSWNSLALSTTEVTRHTRIFNPQPPQWNYELQVFPECAQIAKITVASMEVDVAAGGSAESAVRCPTGSSPVGGGFDFRDHHSFGYSATIAAEFIGDGWLFATTNAPARGEASGTRVKAWYVTGVNQQVAGSYWEDTAWTHRAGSVTEPEYLYLNNKAASPGDTFFRGHGSAIPAARPMTVNVVCATIDAVPTEPAKAPEPTTPRPVLPPAIDLAPTAVVPTTVVDGIPPTAITIGVPPSQPPAVTPVPTTTPSPSASVTPAPTRTTQPQPPSVTINQPADHDQVCAG